MPHAHTPSHRPRLQRRWLRILLAAVLTSLVAATLQFSSQPAIATVPVTDTIPEPETPADPGAPEQPNILLITTDDQSVADLKRMPETRRLLGRQGATFTDAVSSYPLCCPARATLLTGQLSHNHGVRRNNGVYGGYDALAAQEAHQKTLGVWLQGAGYNTMFAGKYLTGYQAADGIEPGWDRWYATVGGIYNYTDFRITENDTVTTHRNSYQTDEFGDLTRAHIDESLSAEQPFFIWESHLAPHDACYPSRRGCKWGSATPAQQDRRKFRRLRLASTKDPSFNERVVSEKPAHIRALRTWGPGKNAVLAEKNRMRVRSLQAVDRSVAKTVALLDEHGELDNTLIIFTSDNGYMLGQHRWRGKVLPYEPSLQVPLLMRWPDGGIPAGVTRPQTAALVDLPRTIADAAQVEPMLTPDGRSLLPIARGEDGAGGYGAMSIESGAQGGDRRDRRWFYRGVRTKRYTFVQYTRSGETELYDRRKDPSQLTNVAYRPAYRPVRVALAHKLSALRDCVGDECLSVDGNVPAPLPEPYLRHGRTVHPDDLGSIGGARQVVTITAANWRTGKGRLTAWTRKSRTWTVRRGPVTVQLGRNGLIQDRLRRQGAGETPAGSFRPERAFGLRPKPRTSLPYDRVDKDDYWVSDPRVPATYNINQPRRAKDAQWRARYAVRWARYAGRFPHAMLMRYNLPRRVRRAAAVHELRASSPADVRKGSFVLHPGKRLGQHGWVSMNQGQLSWLLRWMRPGTQRTTFVVGTPGYLLSRL